MTSVLTQSKLATFLQAFKPSTHVCSKLESTVLAQLLNQAPPRAQQLRLPNLLTTAHLGHTGRIVPTVVAAVLAVPDGADIGGQWVKEI